MREYIMAVVLTFSPLLAHAQGYVYTPPANAAGQALKLSAVPCADVQNGVADFVSKYGDGIGYLGDQIATAMGESNVNYANLSIYSQKQLPGIMWIIADQVCSKAPPGSEIDVSSMIVKFLGLGLDKIMSGGDPTLNDVAGGNGNNGL